MKSLPSAVHRLSARESFLFQIDQPPWSVLSRIAIGYTLPFVYHWGSSHGTGWVFLLWFICALISLRVFPAVFRKLFPFSQELKKAWMERRMVTKLYDSYQWRKLIWFGIGLAVYMASSGTWDAPICVLAVFCLVSGGVGVFFWRKRSGEGISLSSKSDIWIGSGRRV